MAATIKNEIISVQLDSLNEEKSGTYLLGDSKIVNITFLPGGEISVEEVYDLKYTPKGKFPKALRPLDVAKLYRFVTPDFRDFGCEYSTQVVFNPGKYGSHKALAVIRKIQVPGGTIEVEEKRFRLDKALNGTYTCPAWLLGQILFEFDLDPFEDDSLYEGYLKKIEVTQIPEMQRERRRPRTLEERHPRRPALNEEESVTEE